MSGATRVPTTFTTFYPVLMASPSSHHWRLPQVRLSPSRDDGDCSGSTSGAYAVFAAVTTTSIR
jgi:hypothetical protein